MEEETLKKIRELLEMSVVFGNDVILKPLIAINSVGKASTEDMASLTGIAVKDILFPVSVLEEIGYIFKSELDGNTLRYALDVKGKAFMDRFRIEGD